MRIIRSESSRAYSEPIATRPPDEMDATRVPGLLDIVLANLNCFPPLNSWLMRYRLVLDGERRQRAHHSALLVTTKKHGDPG